jgi:rubrerythrin
MIRKINKGSLFCFLCKNKYHTNIQTPTLIKKSPKIQDKHESLIEIKEKSLILFNSLDDDEKSSYYSFHLTIDDFQRIRKNLISLGNDKFTKDIIDRLEYWDVFKSNNQMKFTSVFYDPKENIIIKKYQPKFICDNCDLIWIAKNIESVKNQYRILCPSCKFVNKTFKKRNIKNINDENLLYQSKLEKKFIDWCNDKKLLITNGPKLEYIFGEKKRTYHLDFDLPTLKILVEIKDSHIWHLNELKSGVWNCKEKAAEKYVNENQYKNFILLTPKNWIEKTKELFNQHKLINNFK